MMTMEWQLIETAPKDGTPVLGYHTGKMTMTTVYWGLWNEWQLVESGTYPEDDDWLPTHWMPLPAPPTEPKP
jgi:hypothetical protein